MTDKFADFTGEELEQIVSGLRLDLDRVKARLFDCAEQQRIPAPRVKSLKRELQTGRALLAGALDELKGVGK